MIMTTFTYSCSIYFCHIVIKVVSLFSMYLKTIRLSVTSFQQFAASTGVGNRRVQNILFYRIQSYLLLGFF